MKRYLIRLVSSNDHRLSQDELIDVIERTGTDRYDPKRKHIAFDFYEKHNVDFFAESDIDETNAEVKLAEMIRKFPERTKGDRGVAVHPDIAIIYDASKCEMIMDVYDSHPISDCFRFKGNPLDALVEVRKV